ncbi:MAG: hypothetical protein RIE08_16935 [Acidimicrobiales bacterium]
MTDTGIGSATLHELVAAAVMAPSSHNTQPWLFELTPDGIALHADRTRALPVNDPYDRELTISCGAALRNLELAAAHLRLTVEVTLLPDPADEDLLAHVEVSGDGPPASDAVEAMYSAIPGRHTTRVTFEEEAVPDALPERLVGAAAAHGATLQIIGPRQRQPIADVVSEGDRAQFADPRWRRELASWMHPRRRGDGLVVPEVVGLVTRTAVSALNLGESTAGSDVELVQAAPVLCVLATDHDDTRAWIDAGRALEDVLLTAAAAGLTAGHLNQPCQIPALRTRLQALVPERRHPQVIVRLGRPSKKATRSPRRPVDDVIVGERTS